MTHGYLIKADAERIAAAVQLELERDEQLRSVRARVVEVRLSPIPIVRIELHPEKFEALP